MAIVAARPAPTGRLVRGPSDTGFRIGLYLEHLEEASFLYDQRLALLEDAELAWYGLAPFEQRLEAHLDALLLGGELASAVCVQQAREGDAGELFAALCLLARRRELAPVRTILEALDPGEDERVAAAAHALCLELPPEWSAEPARLVASASPAERRVGARVLGFRRLGHGPAVLEALRRAGPDELADLIWAIGRLRETGAAGELAQHFMKTDDRAVRAAAGFALLRLGELRVVPACVELARTRPAPLGVIGVGGDARYRDFLAQQGRGEEGDPEALLALGLLGDTSAVGPLLEALALKTTAAAAALALNTITGAELYVEVAAEEPTAPDELLDDESAGAAPPPGSAAKRVELTTDAGAWISWLRQNATRFQAGVRYRGGQPHSARAVLATLASGRSPRRLRELAAEELLVRYGTDPVLETEMLVHEQRARLSRLGAAPVAVAGAV